MMISFYQKNFQHFPKKI